MESFILIGDNREGMATLPEKSVNCCVTSPPYYGLRDYDLPPAIWGGSADCAHEWLDVETFRKASTNGREGSTLASAGSPKTIGVGAADVGLDRQTKKDRSAFCEHCGAWRGCLGLEPTPDLYVQHVVMVFREVWRVLRDDGTVWLNIGDSYARTGGTDRVPPPTATTGGTRNTLRQISSRKQRAPDGLKDKDLLMIPAQIALALRADGWYLRSDIIWSKPNTMPESVTDRPTRAHEYIFLLSKSAKYYYDHEAIKEPSVSTHPSGNGYKRKARLSYADNRGVRGNDEQWVPGKPRNRRTVWTVNTKPFKDAHFATFPPELIEPCVLAGCPEGGTVLDPFFGAGTTGLVAQRLRRYWIGCELNEEYAQMAHNRIADDVASIV